MQNHQCPLIKNYELFLETSELYLKLSNEIQNYNDKIMNILELSTLCVKLDYNLYDTLDRESYIFSEKLSEILKSKSRLNNILGSKLIPSNGKYNSVPKCVKYTKDCEILLPTLYPLEVDINSNIINIKRSKNFIKPDDTDLSFQIPVSTIIKNQSLSQDYSYSSLSLDNSSYTNKDSTCDSSPLEDKICYESSNLVDSCTVDSNECESKHESFVCDDNLDLYKFRFMLDSSIQKLKTLFNIMYMEHDRIKTFSDRYKIIGDELYN